MTAEPHVAVPCVSVVLPARAESVGEARRLVREFARAHGARGARLAAIVLAVSEAAANVVVHAYDDPQGTMRVEADVEDGELELVVLDEGRGFSDEEGPGLGLGLGLVQRDTIAFEVRDRELGGVEVWARFALAA